MPNKPINLRCFELYLLFWLLANSLAEKFNNDKMLLYEKNSYYANL